MPRRTTPDPLSIAIGQQLRRLRKAQGLTLERLAVESESGSKGYLSDLEKGLVHPTVQTLERLACRLGVELIDLVVNPQRDLRGRLLEASRDLSPTALAKLIAITQRLSAATNHEVVRILGEAPLISDVDREIPEGDRSG